jgi:hypothetical protein
MLAIEFGRIKTALEGNRLRVVQNDMPGIIVEGGELTKAARALGRPSYDRAAGWCATRAIGRLTFGWYLAALVAKRLGSGFALVEGGHPLPIRSGTRPAQVPHKCRCARNDVAGMTRLL